MRQDPRRREAERREQPEREDEQQAARAHERLEPRLQRLHLAVQPRCRVLVVIRRQHAGQLRREIVRIPADVLVLPALAGELRLHDVELALAADLRRAAALVRAVRGALEPGLVHLVPGAAPVVDDSRERHAVDLDDLRADNSGLLVRRHLRAAAAAHGDERQQHADDHGPSG